MNIFEHYKNVGKTFGRLTITRVYKKVNNFYYWYKCECGKEGYATAGHILKGNTTSCGCYMKEARLNVKLRSVTHGMSRTKEYAIYLSAKARCGNKNVKFYKDYGGRGIMFLFTSFEEFYQHIGPKPTPKHQLDRINNDGNYEIGNVRWATAKENSNNRRSSKV